MYKQNVSAELMKKNASKTTDNLIKQSECRDKQVEHHVQMVFPALNVSMKNHMPKVTISLTPWG